MGNIKISSVFFVQWAFLLHLVTEGWTTQFSPNPLPVSHSFTLTTMITSQEVFVTFSNESKTTMDFLSLNESVNNPDLSFISASISMRYLKKTWNILCANKSSNNSIIKLAAQLTTLDDVYEQIERTTRSQNEVVGPVEENCTNKFDSTCNDYGDFFSDVINETNPIKQPNVEIPLELTCVDEDDGTKIEIEVLPVLHKWLEELETCNKNPMGSEKDAANLERFVFRFILAMDQLNLTKVNTDVPSPSGLEIIKESEISLSVKYFKDQRCRVLYNISKEVKGRCEAGEECLSYETRNVCRLRSYCSVPECRVGCDFEDNEGCTWSWRKPKSSEDIGFRVTSVAQALSKIQQLKGDFSAPIIDANNKTEGNFLLLAWEKNAKTQAQYRLTSPTFVDSQSTCNLQAKVHMNNMENVELKMVIGTLNHSSYVPMAVLGNRRNTWESLKQMVGKRVQPFQIILEVDNPIGVPSHFAIDDIRLVDCFPNKVCVPPCVDKEFKCNDGSCISRNQICDLNKDCLDGEDESHPNCENLPPNSTCTFEEGWCGWTPVNQYNITWERTRRSYYTDTNGPQFDHTYQNTSGHFLLVNMKVKSSTFHQAVLRSPILAIPPPYHQNRTSKFFESCQLRFFYHMHGGHVGTLDAEVVLKNPRNPRTKPIRFCERSGNQGNMWHRAVCKLPSIKGSRKYYIQITATRGLRGHVGDIGIDDISLSPECFGQGVPPSETVGYNYSAILGTPDDNPKNSTAYKLTTCNNTGRLGPSGDQCRIAYEGTAWSSMVSMDPSRDGVQVWTVPESKSYTLIAKGASGGRGALVNQMTSHGSIVRVTQYLRKGENIHVLVGQEGTSLCDQANGYSAEREQICRSEWGSSLSLLRNIPLRKNARQAPSFPTSKPRPQEDPLKALGTINRLYGGGGGGGGGATYIYRIVDGAISLLLVAAGGGGLGYNASTNIYPNGRSLNVSLEPHSGSTQPWGAGGGGGFQGYPVKNNNSAAVSISTSRFQKIPEFQNVSTTLVSAGLSLVEGRGVGGEPCSPAATWGAAGGFGGGGGGCTSGGGGGGYVGGNGHVSLSSNGEGGWSFIGKGGMYPAVDAGGHVGPGEFIVIPSFPGCGCEHSCVLLDDFEPHTGCVCPENWVISEDGVSCEGRDFPGAYLIAIIILCVITFCVVGILCFYLYNRYQRKKVNILRRKVMGPELQLSRLRAQSGPGGVLTEYNPNYEFGGETYTLTDLKEIPRENLRLVKALGQGAFGEVYQGFYRHRDGDAVEMPVAVKTLPELSSNQAEMDFLMEALIMSKFNHPNIVHFIGVCFDKHPRFIILELLAGGDLKTFLRESRPKPDKGSPLSMKDLLLCAMDVAKGCKYLEDNHFIHRDIAARNCLLTTKGPGRVVKIADFGMARDIYRADYYKKGGKAMLPVKWMPPEAFLDGIFTSKTDAWSYGVLLWEIFSLGYMPYPGRGNQDVMQLVTNGGRLEPPSNCPTPVYGIMSQCWHPIPEERPNFATIMERIGYCIQDPEVVNAPLPIFQRPPSSERDVTLMRPPNSDDSSCLRIIHGHHHRSRNPSPLSHNEPLSPNCSTGDYLVPLTPLSNPTTPPPPPEARGVTASSRTGGAGGAGSEVMPESESTETILDEEDEGESPVQTSTKKGGSKRQNGIDSGITLKATALKEESSGSGSRHPAPYVNVGSKKREGNVSDEEIRC